MIPTFVQLRSPMVDKEGMITRDWQFKLQEYETKLGNALTLLGDIQAQTKIQGRTEGIGTTVQNLTDTGMVNSTDNIIDGTGLPLSGGKRGQIGFDSNSRLTSSFRTNPVNVSGTPTSVSILSNDGVSTVINVATSTQQFGPGGISYNSGSVDPGVFGSFAVFADDPTFAGGSMPYQFSATVPDQTANDSRIVFGAITTAGGTPHTGGGYGGGDTPGGGGGRGYNKF